MSKIKKVHIKENSWVARIAARYMKYGHIAIVIGRTIHLYNTKRDDFLRNRRWLAHELKHVQQFEQHGYLPFLFRYLVESLKHGYYSNRYEAEARACEQDMTLLERYAISPARRAK